VNCKVHLVMRTDEMEAHFVDLIPIPRETAVELHIGFHSDFRSLTKATMDFHQNHICSGDCLFLSYTPFLAIVTSYAVLHFFLPGDH
jgi:hypothetical protein